MRISLITPTRNRPENILRLVNSALETAKYKNQLEFIFYIDIDDTISLDALRLLKIQNPNQIKYLQGGRIILSEMWNRAYDLSSADIVMHCGDDIIFRTKYWDQEVIKAFDSYDDKLVFVHGNDGYWVETFGTHGFLHKNWIKICGYFLPPYFSSDYNDTWLNDISNLIKRRVYIDIYTEHMHPNLGKAELDLNHIERLERHKKDNVDKVYSSFKMRLKRYTSATKLKFAITQNLIARTHFLLNLILLEIKINILLNLNRLKFLYKKYFTNHKLNS
jgi:glycosyltransferase involved in cell wall biosynthesis